MKIIDIEEYITKPIVSSPMQVFPHFHWIAIEGKRPVIPENFIREEYKNINSATNENGEEKPKTDMKVDLNEIKGQTTISLYQSGPVPTTQTNLNDQYSNLQANNINIEKKSGRSGNIEVVSSIIHNISKELQIFFENFQDRFRKEIKKSLITQLPLVIITKEFALSKSF